MGYNSGITTMGGRAGGGARGAAGRMPQAVGDFFKNYPQANTALISKGEGWDRTYTSYDKGVGKVETFGFQHLDTKLPAMVKSGRKVGIVDTPKKGTFNVTPKGYSPIVNL